MTVFDVRNTSPELADARPWTAVLPIGAIEQHGRALPLATDWLQADAVARAIAERLRHAYLLPALPYSCSQIHADFPGTVSLEPATLDRVIKDLVGCLFEQGLRRVLLVNFHGGNFILRSTVRDLNHSSPEAKVVMVWPWLTAADELAAILDTTGEVHAGELEVSLVLAIEPALVRSPSAADDFEPAVTHEHMDYRRLREVSPSGVWGHPSHGARDKGERAIAAMAERVAAHVEAVFASLGLPAIPPVSA
jgi:creatinine amidohydrolase